MLLAGAAVPGFADPVLLSQTLTGAGATWEVAEIAVFRPTTGQWFALDLASGNFALVPWGAIGLADLPLPQPARLR